MQGYYKCTICQTFLSKSSLSCHLLFKHKNVGKTYCCLLCTKTFSLPYTLSNHIKSNHGPQHIQNRTTRDKTHAGTASLNDHKRYKQSYLKGVTRKQTLRSLSLSYQKKDGRVWPHPSFFWYDTDFSEFDSADIIDYILEKSVSYQKKHGRGHVLV